MEELWKKILAEIQLEVSPATFVTLFKPTSLSSYVEGVVTINCPSPILSSLVETRYYTLLKRVFDKHLNFNTSIVFTTSSVQKKEFKRVASENSLGPLFTNTVKEDLLKKARLSPLFTFENFAVSGTNQLAFAAAQAVAKKPSGLYNPLFIYGGVGVGKTHLMQAIGNCFVQRQQRSKVLFCMGEEFTNELIFSIRNRATREFKEKFRNADLLLIDDIQFIAGKDAVQEEFFHTFNVVMNKGGQIVLASDKPADNIKRLETKLVSRFEGGLMVDIEPPDFALRTAILLIKARIRGVNLTIEVAKILAANIEGTRKLEGALIRLITEAQTRDVPIDEELAKKIVGKTSSPIISNSATTKEDFLNIVCSFYEVGVSEIKGKDRKSTLVLPRHILIYLLRKDLGLSLVKIGDFLGGRDHTTIMYAVQKIDRLLEKRPKITEDILLIKERVYKHSSAFSTYQYYN